LGILQSFRSSFDADTLLGLESSLHIAISQGTGRLLKKRGPLNIRGFLYKERMMFEVWFEVLKALNGRRYRLWGDISFPFSRATLVQTSFARFFAPGLGHSVLFDHP
jgi:hypothetical protein